MKENQKKELLKISISALLLVIAVIADKFILPQNTVFIFRLIPYIFSYIVVSYDVLKNAFINIIHGNIFDEQFLMTIAGIGAFFVGEYPEAVIIMLFYQIGELFQDSAVESSRDSIKELLTLAPETANVIRNGETFTVKASNVGVGELILVKPGEKVPLDGIIVSGNSTFDTSALTGESMPVNIAENELVLSASLNMTNAVTVKVEKKYEDSTATLITQTVENAVEQKPKVDKFITRFAKYYTPIVCVTAVIVSVFVPLIFKLNISEWVYRGLMLLVISCPCALVVSVPLGFFISIGRAAKNGILVKGCSTMEIIKNASSVYFDKTGTLTKGNFAVSEIKPQNITEKDLLFLAAAAEKYSNHPIAKAICVFAENTGCSETSEYSLSDITEIPGKGITALHNGQKLLAGNASLLFDNGITIEKIKQPGTVIHIALGQDYLGYILIADEIKNNSPEAINKLHSLGVENTVMLTGDNDLTARNVAKKIGITDVYSGLLPDEKYNIVSDAMKRKNKKDKIIFVGDGINDSPSISCADIGIAMGKSGTDIAIEVADAVIMDDDIEKIPYLVALSKKTMNIMMWNIVFSLSIKAIVFILSLIGISNMWFAIFADVGTLIIAILNTLRIKK